MVSTVYCMGPLGASTVTVSPARAPIRALPTGDSSLMAPALKSDSWLPTTQKVMDRPPPTGVMVTLLPMLTTSVEISSSSTMTAWNRMFSTSAIRE